MKELPAVCESSSVAEAGTESQEQSPPFSSPTFQPRSGLLEDFGGRSSFLSHHDALLPQNRPDPKLIGAVSTLGRMELLMAEMLAWSLVFMSVSFTLCGVSIVSLQNTLERCYESQCQSFPGST